MPDERLSKAKIARLVDSACDRFEEAWNSGVTPRIEDFLSSEPRSVRSHLFKQLLLLEMDLQKEIGTSPDVAEYERRFPNNLETIRRIFGSSIVQKRDTLIEQGQRSGTHRAGRSDKTRTLAPSRASRRGQASSDSSDVGKKQSGDRFRILRPHARGGLGEVFVARDEELNRNVALKRIQDYAANSEAARSRFALEAEVTGKLEHPGVVPVYGFGRSSDDQLYYAMRFIEGESLKDAIDRFHTTRWSTRQSGARSVRLRQLLQRFVAVCNAIAYAHSRGVIHRDLKPDNVMLGSFGETIVVDWGLAKRREEDSKYAANNASDVSVSDANSGSSPTQAGTVLGTPAYMPPEQASGRVDELGPPADVYSLGATLYYLLTGCKPFPQSRIEEVLAHVAKGEFKPPREHSRSIGRRLNAICLKAMSLEPARRYDSASGLASEIEQWLADQPVTAYQENVVERLMRWSRHHRGWVRVVAAVLLVTAIAATIIAVLLNQAYLREQRLAIDNHQLAAIQHQLADENRDLAEARKEALEKSEVSLYLNRIALAARELKDGNHGRAGELLAACPRERRRWEWSYLNSLRRSGLLTIKPQRDRSQVQRVLFSPGGDHLIAGRDQEVMMWDLGIGPTPRTLTADGGYIGHVVMSRDGSRLAATIRFPQDSHIRIWEYPSGKLLHKIDGHEKPVQRLALSPDGSQLASQSAFGSLKLWDLDNPSINATLHSQAPRDGCVVFSPNGQTLATVNRRQCLLWDLKSRKVIRRLEGPTLNIEHLAFSADGSKIAAACVDTTVRIWETDSGELISTYWGHTDRVVGVSFRPDGNQLASCSYDRTIRIWNTASGEPMRVLRGHDNWVTNVAYNATGQYIASADYGGTIKLWDSETEPGRIVITVRDPEQTPGNHSVAAARFTADGHQLVTYGGDGNVRFGHMQSDRGDIRFQGGKGGLDLAISPNGQFIGAVNWKGQVRVWRADSDSPTISLGDELPAEFGAWVVGFSPDSEQVAAVDPASGTLQLLDPRSGNVRMDLGPFPPRSKGVAFAHDGSALAVSGGPKVTLRDAKTGELLFSWEDLPSLVVSLAFSPDGKTLVALCEKGSLHAWDVESRQSRFSRVAHSQQGTRAIFHPDGQRIFTAGYDGNVKVWTADTGIEVLTLRSGGRWVRDVEISPDEKTLVAANENNTVTIWRSTNDAADLIARDETVPSNHHSEATVFLAYNECDYPLTVTWVDYEGNDMDYGIIGPGERRWQGSEAGHCWVFRDPEGKIVGTFFTDEHPRDLVLRDQHASKSK